LEYTQKCIEHIRLSSVPCEIVLVDNASTDGTEEWALAQDDLVYVRNRVNLYCGPSRNQGAYWASGDYLWFVDNDQFVAKDSLERLLAKKAIIVGIELWEISTDSGDTRPSTKLNHKSYVGGGGLLVEASVFRAMGGLDERFAPAWYSDADFCFRARALGLSLECVPGAGVEHLGGTTVGRQDYSSTAEKARSKNLFSKIWSSVIFQKKEPVGAKLPVRMQLEMDQAIRERREISQGIRGHLRKPKILIVADVHGWAWDNKSRQLQRFLSNEFDIDIHYQASPRKPIQNGTHDLYFGFGLGYAEAFHSIDKDRKVVGVTAHSFKDHPKHMLWIQAAGFLHANSKMLMEELEEVANGCRVFYLPNGVDEDLFNFRKRDTSDTFRAAYAGKGNSHKHFHDVIVPACVKADVELMSQVCKFDDRSCIPHRNMPGYFEMADVILIASSNDGTPNQLLEGAAVGRTFIGCRIGNVPEFVQDGENGFMVERSVDAFADKLVYLKTKRKQCRSMGIEARHTIETGWTWEKQAENYRFMFREILG
jgi:GT2 family glycosyltransferase